MYETVPIVVPVAVSVEVSWSLAIPKSPSQASPFMDSNMFEGFTSR
jgi:hypothetical protein